jgi:hypothetical protein
VGNNAGDTSQGNVAVAVGLPRVNSQGAAVLGMRVSLKALRRRCGACGSTSQGDNAVAVGYVAGHSLKAPTPSLWGSKRVTQLKAPPPRLWGKPRVGTIKATTPSLWGA